MNAGEFAAAGKPIYKVADLDNMYLRAYFTSAQIADMKIGQKVKVTADFGDEKNMPTTEPSFGLLPTTNSPLKTSRQKNRVPTWCMQSK